MTWDKLEPVNHSGVTIIGLKKVSKLNYKSVLCGVANSVHRINLLKVFQQAKLVRITYICLSSVIVFGAHL